MEKLARDLNKPFMKEKLSKWPVTLLIRANKYRGATVRLLYTLTRIAQINDNTKKEVEKIAGSVCHVNPHWKFVF